MALDLSFITDHTLDHLRDKKFNISWGIMNRGRKKIFEEIEKCEVVCAICHAYRTHKRAL